MLITSMTLYAFLENFERLLEHHHYEELQANFRSTKTKAKLLFEVEILNHVVSLYTSVVLNMFQIQVCIYIYIRVMIVLLYENETLLEYKVVLKKR